MTDYQSVYNNHYGGETYRFGVAYLRQEKEDYEPDFYAGRYPSLDEQRKIIADLAIKAQTIVIAEFVDNCGPIAVEDRLGLFRLLEFWERNSPASHVRGHRRSAQFQHERQLRCGSKTGT